MIAGRRVIVRALQFVEELVVTDLDLRQPCGRCVPVGQRAPSHPAGQSG
jgi:hypothetical protein